VPTAATGFAGIAFAYLHEYFPSEHTLVGEHLHKAIQAPVIEDRPMLCFQMFLMFLRDHLPLGKVSDHNSSLNQFVSDETGGFMQTITTLGTLLLGDALVDLR
jgi:hypothetical protein